MRIAQFHPATASETELQAWYDGITEIRRPRTPLGVDEPYEVLVPLVQHAPSLAPEQHWVAWDDGRLVGYAWFSWYDTDENKHRLDVSLDITPGRPDVVRELLRAVVDVAREHGKTLAAFEAYESSPERAVLAECGAEVGLVDQRNVLDLSGVSAEFYEQLIATCAAGAPDYDLVRFDGPVPDELLDQYLAVKDAMNTAPRGELDWEDVNYTHEKQRSFERVSMQRGQTRWMTCVRHRESDRLVGLTELVVYPTKGVVMYQGDTTVVPAHRGHKLGLWIKATNLLRLVSERPDVPGVVTWNADTNTPMVDVNRTLGFRLQDRVETREISVDALAAALGS